MKIITLIENLLNGNSRKFYTTFLLIILAVATIDFTNKVLIKPYKNHFTKGNYSIPYDLLPYYNAGYIIKKGEGSKVYNYQFQKESFLELHTKYIKGSPPPETGYFYNPPNSLIFVYFLSLVSPLSAWLIIKLISLSIVGFSVYSAIPKKDGKNTWIYTTILLLGLMYFSPLLINLRNGQFSLLIACSFYFYWYFSKYSQLQYKEILAGFFLSLTLIKPQIGIPLLLIPLWLQQWRILFFCICSTFIFFLSGIFLIGIEGFKTYLFSTLELIGLQKANLKVPIPGGPECLAGQLQALKISSTLIPKITNLFNIICLALIFFTMKDKSKNHFPIEYKVFIIGSLSLFLGSYHTDNDYCLIIALILILVLSQFKYWKFSIICFSIISFIGTYLLDRINIHTAGEIIRLREHTYIKTYFLLTLITIIILQLKNNKRDRDNKSQQDLLYKN